MTVLPCSLATRHCPCGLPLPYLRCCGQWHQGTKHLQAPDAATLMRSRYSAFVLDNASYLLATWHPSTRPEKIEPNPDGIKWLGLELRAHTVNSDTRAEVEFIARHRLHGRATRLHEHSRFLREQGQWFYVDGVFPAG
ncbi:YchJ family metal-binding protein [Paenalcaligenes niemegkensis]|uniref:YchJ family protein n=1 Tax=Paenalcaligenes niemegkensis TaxID=2895469 RepID=UPI001EE81BDD|nr:YchJ family metal-binding protein [Paenalcaligenes niemegkensis]MCQ9616698.1 YchJ family metal-binding protein [Paenalcaligenes niemegkensis]